MNCIQPTAPAELGPMFWPKFDSILLIAASTGHGIPYAAAACSQSGRSCATDSCCGWTGGVVKETGTDSRPGEFGVVALGSATGAAVIAVAERAPVDREKPIGGCARAVPATSASVAIAAAAARFISPRRRP